LPTLAKYRQMRDFERTREPRGTNTAEKRSKKLPRGAPALSFVVQKHDARNLHYDFRLELDGVLLSWAVPKGPSLDPSVKRLAMEVEPHPLEYGGFEGTIPAGEYGGGTVMVWDRGTWTPEGDPHQALAKGHLSFSLQGQKLKGAWHLVRTKRLADDKHGNKQGKGWLLFKSRDDAARAEDTLLDDEPNSALSGRNLAQIARAEGEGEKAPDSRPRKRTTRGNTTAPEETTTKTKAKTKAKAKAKKAAKPGAAQLPTTISPELATLVDSAPAGDDWVHEIKLDGYRILARIVHGKVTLLTRNGKDWTERMPTLRQALETLEVETAVLDGELVALDAKGVSHFQSLQNALHESGDGSLVYYAFDLLHLDGEDTTTKPLLERKSLLRELLDRAEPTLEGRVRLSAHVVGKGPEFFENACKLGLEGTIAKRASSPYRAGRGRDWLKIKCGKDQEFAIVGYTEPGGSRSHFGALLVATKKDDELTYAGKVGTGFSEASLSELHAKLRPLKVSEPVFARPPRGAQARGVTWVKPRLVAQIGFTETTSDGLLRHPTFKGLRDDKPAREVKLETPATATAPRHYPITHPDKVLYPEQGITKQEVLDYYALVAERMLPHVANRPLTLVRCPNGYGKACFFQKHPGAGTPPGLRSIAIREKEGKSPYSVLDDEQGLFALVQLGALEIHTWGSRADDFEHPDILVFDLDPDEAVAYQAVIDGALAVRKVFERAKLETFVKTTGGKGLHVCVPILPDLSWDEAKDFTERIAAEMARQAPSLYVATQSKAKRKGKTFIDYLRNGRGATFIAPYSTRARAGAPIAVPLDWDELSVKLPPNHFNIRNVQKRLAQLRHDPFERLAQVEQRLPTERHQQ
jgi:bifunctional non-homologous end joining protein LigD